MRKTKPVLFLLLMLALALALPLSAGISQPRVVILIMDKITLADLARHELPNIAWVVGRGGLGLMNNRTGGVPGIAGHAYLSIGSGGRALGTASLGQAYAAGDVLEGGTAAEILFRNTGYRAERDNLVLPGVAEILALNAARNHAVQPGLLGRTLHEAGLVTCALGNADVPEIPGRQIVSLLMDEHGLVDRGSIGTAMVVPDPAWPFGLRTDYEALLAAYDRLAPGAAVVAVETGDTTRLDLYAPYLAPARLAVLRRRALQAADGFLGEIRKRLDLSRTLLLVVTPSSAASALAQGDSLTPLIAAGPDLRHGLLVSSSTKRSGVVTNRDIVPTILTHLNLVVPSAAAGSPLRTAAGSADSPWLLRENARLAAVEYHRQPLLKFYTVFLEVIFVVCALLLFRRGIPGTAASRAVLLLAAVFPLVLLLVPIHPILERPLSLAGLGLIFTAALSIRGWKQPLRSLFLLCAGTVAALALDQACGGPLARYSMLSYSPVTGARYYGLGNEYMGVSIGAGVIGAALAYERWHGRRWLPLTAGAVFTGLTVVIGAPNLGANVGGSLAAAIGFGAAFLGLEGKRISWRTLLLTMGLVGGILLLLALADSIRPPSTQTHLGRLVSSIVREGAGAFWQVAARKVAMNFKLVINSDWSRVILCALLAMASFLYPSGQKRARHYPYLAKGILACFPGAAAAFIFNDSGVLAAATLLIYPVTALFYVAMEDNNGSKVELEKSGRFVVDQPV